MSYNELTHQQTQPTPVSPATPAPPAWVLWLGATVLLFIAAGLGGFAYGRWWRIARSPETPPLGGGGTACTLEAKMCPDGSSVGRTGPKCEFAPCPSPAAGGRDLPATNLKRYEDSHLGLSLWYPADLQPSQTLQSGTSGEPVLLISQRFHFDTAKLPRCSEQPSEVVCVLPGSAWGQAQDVQPQTLKDVTVQSFFLEVKNADGSGSKVFHVVQHQQQPTFEIALTVDGVGLEQQFQALLQTVELKP